MNNFEMVWSAFSSLAAGDSIWALAALACLAAYYLLSEPDPVEQSIAIFGDYVETIEQLHDVRRQAEELELCEDEEFRSAWSEAVKAANDGFPAALSEVEWEPSGVDRKGSKA